MKLAIQKKISLFLFSLFLLFILSVLFLPNKSNYFNNYNKIRVKIKNKTYTLFVADTKEKKGKGLSNIPSIKNNQGMIFIFDKSDYYNFWMKDMNFPLDFIFLQDNKLVDFLLNVSPDTYPQTFTSKIPADRIIEIKTGEIKKIKIGDEVKFL